MQCPACEAANSEERRFCADCGAALPSACAECGFANHAEAKYCGGCGRPLAAAPQTPSPPEPAAGRGERRQVTMLFVDLAGFTELSSRLDAEELRELIDRFYGLADRTVEAYGGTVDKHLGDGVMALFGAPLAHGDDPLRALRAAFDIHAGLGALGAELGRELAVHAGVASGEVVAGGLGGASRQEYTVLGESVNLAARLDALAEPGETLISEAVQRAVGEAVDCAPLGEVAVKGLERPVRVWRARGLRAEGAAAHRGALVGRGAELRQLAGLLEACEEGAGQAVLLRGEAGIGKTRLVEELTARARGFAAHRGLVLDFGVGKGQGAIRSLVRSLLGARAEADAEERAAALEAAVAAGELEAERRVFLNDLLDLPQSVAQRSLYDAMDGDARTRGKREAILALIRKRSAEAPLLLAVEDLHWAEPLTLAHLAAITAAVRDCRALLVMTTRIEGDPLDRAWRGATGGSPLTTIDLAPLREAEAQEFARRLPGVGDQVVRDCIARAEGNPLFLEQLLRNAEESAEAAVPASIQSLVLARMDRLPDADKAALQAAAVIGQRFGLASLRHLVEDPRYDCTGLIDHYLVRPEGDDFLFAHALIREGVYSSLLKSHKRALHGRAARWFAGQDPVLHAEHLDRAEDSGAARAYLAAARAQAETYRYERALALIERGIEIADEAPDRFALTCFEGELLHDAGSIPESTAACRKALELATTDAERCRAWIGLAAGMRIVDELDGAFDALAKAEELAVREGLTARLAEIHHLRGNLCFPLGRLDDCLAAHEASLDYARRCASAEAEAEALGGMGDALYAKGRMASAHGYFRRCVALCKEHGFGRIEVANFPMLAHTGLFIEGPAAALPTCLAAVEEAERVGHHRAALNAELSAFFALVELCEWDEADRHLARGTALGRQLGARRFDATTLAWQGRIAYRQGRSREALDLAREALEICRETGPGFNGPRVISILALATDDGAERRRLLAEGEDLLSRGSVGHNHLMFYRDAIDVMLDERDWAAAEGYAARLEDFTGAEPLLWSRLFAGRGRALAALGRSPDDAAAVARLRRLRDEVERVGFRISLPAMDRALGAVEAPAPPS